MEARGASFLSSARTAEAGTLILGGFVVAWALYRVSSRHLVLADPCMFAFVAAAGLVTVLWFTWWFGGRALKVERVLLAIFLAGMPLVYLSRYLSVTRADGPWFWVELAAVPLFGVLALLGLRRSPGFLAAGIAAHGAGWDSWHFHSAYIPDWYAIGCLLVDLALASYVALRIPLYVEVESKRTLAA